MSLLHGHFHNLTSNRTLRLIWTRRYDCICHINVANPIFIFADYLDYQNMRATYIENYLDKLVNWDFVNSNLPANA